MDEKKDVTTTEKKIGRITYIVSSSASENATDTLEKKITKLIKKDVDKENINV